MENNQNTNGTSNQKDQGGTKGDLKKMDHLLVPWVRNAKTEGRMDEYYEHLRSGFSVDSRKLYNFLYPGEDHYDDWVKEQIVNNPDIIEGIDYISTSKLN